MNIFRLLGVSLALGLLTLSSSVADDDVVPNSATAVKFDFAQWCKVGDHIFVLEKTTLADVIKTLGRGTIRSNGKDAGELEFSVDYQYDNHLISFSSNGEMGGPDHVLGGVEIRPLAVKEKAFDLPMLRLPISFQFGSLGMPFSDLVTALGPAVIRHGVAWYAYLGLGKKPIKVPSGKTLDNEVFGTLRVKVAGGKVAEIQLCRVTSS